MGETVPRDRCAVRRPHQQTSRWISAVAKPRAESSKRPSDSITAKRDLVGELTAAVRAEGLKMGLYYSGGLDWTFEPKPIASEQDMRSTAPKTEEYARYADATGGN